MAANPENFNISAQGKCSTSFHVSREKKGIFARSFRRLEGRKTKYSFPVVRLADNVTGN
jgi:hypothetical protein